MLPEFIGVASHGLRLEASVGAAAPPSKHERCRFGRRGKLGRGLFAAAIGVLARATGRRARLLAPFWWYFCGSGWILDDFAFGHAGSGGGVHAADGFVDVDEDVRLVNDFPAV